jgi:ubiquinone biosynthesis protein
MDRSINLSVAIVIAATVVASALMVHARVAPTFAGYPARGLLDFVVTGVLGVGLAIGILRSGRL